MLIYFCGGKCKILLSVSCHTNLNALVFRTVRVSLKIWSVAGIVLLESGLCKNKSKKEKEGERRKEREAHSLCRVKD